MIKSSIPLSMTESLEYIEKDKNADKNAKEFIKKFVKLDYKDAKELRKKLEKLDLAKMNEISISKVIDMFPEKTEELNKIFVDLNLDENESKKILDTIKEFQ